MKTYIVTILLILSFNIYSQEKVSKPVYSNPIIPDMIADPSIVEFDGVFYCHATTDGYNQGLSTSGPPTLWISKDFVNWSFSGSHVPTVVGQVYWAPSSVTKFNNKYWLYPTINRGIFALVSDSPAGPFRVANGPDSFTGSSPAKSLLQSRGPKGTKGIDAEVFVDDDGQAYMYWAQRGAARLKPDMVTLDTSIIVIPTKRAGYSEGPFFFKRKGIYYYLYTLGGHENYQYAYIYSRVSPLGPFEFPENDIISTTDHEKGIYGPGHGSVFSVSGTDNYYFVYLEFGRGSTTRQVWVDRLEFNPDGTIKPVVLTHEGVGPLKPLTETRKNLAAGSLASASSLMADLNIKSIQDSTFKRIEMFKQANALDGSNGTRWMANETDSSAWFSVDLGKVLKIAECKAYFVKPTAGHAYRLEYSTDGKSWKPGGGHNDVRIQSPHSDILSVEARYLKYTFLKGTPGLWELKIY